MDILYKGISKFLRVALVVIFSLLVICVFWQVFTRYTIGRPSTFTEELARYLLIWLAILGTAYVRSYKGQMAIDYLYNKLSPDKQRNMSIFIEILIFIFALSVMVVGGINLMYITIKLNQILPVLNIPIGYAYSVVPLSGFIIIFFSCYHCRELLRKGTVSSDTDHDLVKMNL